MQPLSRLEEPPRSRPKAVAMRASASIVAPSRLSMSLIDLNGSLGRIDGSFGLSLSTPRICLRARPSDRFSVISTQGDVSGECRSRCERILSAFAERFGVRGVELVFDEVIAQHSGLGSGTQIGMAVGAAISELYGLSLDTLELARIAGRGGTSGVGVESFRAGGFVVEGGHRFGGATGKRDFTPSASSRGFDPGPVLFRRPFPAEWSVLVAVPKGACVHAAEENELFRKICPLPASEVAELCRIVLMQLMPALVEEDLESFGKAIDAVQLTAFKRHEIATQSRWVTEVRHEMQRIGLHGVGMSSWGPALYGFGCPDAVANAQEHLARYMARGEGGTTFVTTADNRGATIQSE